MGSDGQTDGDLVHYSKILGPHTALVRPWLLINVSWVCLRAAGGKLALDWIIVNTSASNCDGHRNVGRGTGFGTAAVVL